MPTRKEYPLLEGRFYFQYWPEPKLPYSRWILRREGNGGRLTILRDHEIRRVFDEFSSVPLVGTESIEKFLEVRVPKGTAASKLCSAFTELARRMPD